MLANKNHFESDFFPCASNFCCKKTQNVESNGEDGRLDGVNQSRIIRLQGCAW